ERAVARPRRTNAKLANAIAESGMSYAQVARAVIRVAGEVGATELSTISRSHVSYWVAGSHPSGRTPAILLEALSRKTGRVMTLEEVGPTSPAHPSPAILGWEADTLTALADLTRTDLDMERRSVLAATAYSVAALVLPGETWWDRLALRGKDLTTTATRAVGR